MKKTLGIALTFLGVITVLASSKKKRKTFFVRNDGSKFRLTHTTWFGHTLVWKADGSVQEFCVEFDDATFAVNKATGETKIFHGDVKHPAECTVISKVEGDFRYVVKNCNKTGPSFDDGTEKFVRNCGNC